MKRVIIFYTAFALAIWGLNLRIAYIQRPENYAVYASNSAKWITVSESRGYIYDRNYKPLVNRGVLHMAAVIPYDGIEQELADNTSAEEMQTVLLGKPCVIQVNYRRPDTAFVRYFDVVQRYVQNSAAHVIGYTDSDGKQGLSGMEKSFNELLSEASGQLKVRFFTDGKGYALPGSKIELDDRNYNAKGGVRLTLDDEIQTLCDAAAEKYGLDAGAIAVLKSDTSEILAAASYPAFDPSHPADALDDEDAPFISRFLCDYTVGSVFKPITAAAALENGVGADRTYVCTGSIEIGGITFHCHNRDGHGELDMSGAMENSCNPYFISLAMEIGAEPIIALAKAMGLGKELVLADACSAESGNLPDSTELANAGGVANLAFGQGSLTATPLQIAAVYACIASDGIYTPPYLLREQLDVNGDSVAEWIPDAGTRVMRQTTAETLQTLLCNTVEYGSGQNAKPEKIAAAGKTATAQSGIYEDGEEVLRTWFCGYFPADDPVYAVAILKENGASPITDCAPIFQYIANHISRSIS